MTNRKLTAAEIEAIIVRTTGNRDIYILTRDDETGYYRPETWIKGHARINAQERTIQ